MKLVAATFIVLLGLVAVVHSSCPAYTCPDSTCAASLADCACVANAVIGEPDASFDRPMTAWSVLQPVNGFAYVSYGIASGNCSTFDFGPFVSFQWNVLNTSTNTLLFQVNSSALSIPPLTLLPGKNYTLQLITKGLKSNQKTMKEVSFISNTPVPRVDITAGGSERRISNQEPIVIHALVNDDFPSANPTFSWACMPIASCPSTANNNITSLTIPANATPGTYEITFTYREESSHMLLTIVSGVVPLVRVLQASAPVVSQPTVYLSTQTINLGSAVSYASNLTYMWVLRASMSNSSNFTDDKELGRGRAISIDASTLELSSMDGSSMVENRITLFAASTSDTTIYGEATISVFVLAAYDLTLTVKKDGDNTATEATALSDKLDLTTVSSTLTEQGGNIPFGLGYQMIFAYLAGNAFLPLNAIPSNNFYITPAPIPAGNGTGSVEVIFQAQLRIGGVVAAVANATFNIVRPNADEAADDQIANAESITDPAAAIAATANIQALMDGASDAVKAKLGAAALTMLTNSITNFDSQTPDQQKAIFDMCFSAVGAQSDPLAKSQLQDKTLNLMKLALASNSFDPKNGLSALRALATVSATKGSSTVALLASKIANDPSIPMGETRKFSAGGVNISAVRETLSDVGGLSTSSGDGSSMDFPNGFTLPGLSSSTVLGVSSAAFDQNPFTGNPEGPVASYQIAADGQEHSVSGLPLALKIKIKKANAASSCRYWDTTTSSWSTQGVTTKVVSGEVHCESVHLTAFATFASSSASAVVAIVPVFVAILGVAFQLLVVG